MTTSRSPTAKARGSTRSLRPTCRPITSSGFRNSSSARGRPHTCPRVQASSSSTGRLQMASLYGSAIRSSGRSPHPDTLPPITPTSWRITADPWMVLTGDALLVGDAGRPDLHAHGEHTVEEMARALYRSLTERLLALPDHLVLYPAHYAGSVCGRGLSGNPISSVGFERRHNRALRFASEDEFVAALVREVPP